MWTIDAPASFREIARILRPGGLFILVDNYAPDDPALDRFINELETLRDPSHVRNHTVRGWSELLRGAGLEPTVDSDISVTKLTTENWLVRSQTPPDRAGEVRRRLREASPPAVEAVQITPATFAVPGPPFLSRVTVVLPGLVSPCLQTTHFIVSFSFFLAFGAYLISLTLCGFAAPYSFCSPLKRPARQSIKGFGICIGNFG